MEKQGSGASGWLIYPRVHKPVSTYVLAREYGSVDDRDHCSSRQAYIIILGSDSNGFFLTKHEATPSELRN